MIAICVDDEGLLLGALERAVSTSKDVEKTVGFMSEFDALSFAKENEFDIAFLDVELHGMNGIELAQNLREINKNCIIVFCTGYLNYAVDAIEKQVVDGYLIKPITADKVQAELDKFKACGRIKNYSLIVDIKGGLKVKSASGEKVKFRRAKTEKLFEFLIGKNGEAVSLEEACVAVWGEKEGQEQKKKDYVYQLFLDLRQAIAKASAESVIVKVGNKYLLDINNIKVNA